MLAFKGLTEFEIYFLCDDILVIFYFINFQSIIMTVHKVCFWAIIQGGIIPSLLKISRFRLIILNNMQE